MRLGLSFFVGIVAFSTLSSVAILWVVAESQGPLLRTAWLVTAGLGVVTVAAAWASYRTRRRSAPESDGEATRLRAELTRRSRERNLVFDILRISASGSGLDEVLDELTHRFGEELALREFAILLRESGDSFVLRSLYGFENPESLRGRSIRFGEGVSGESAEQRQTIVIEDVSQAPEYMAFWDCVSRQGSFASFPILQGGDLVGLLAMTRPADQPFSGVEIRLVEAIVDHLALAIRQVELINELRELSTHDDLTGLPNRRLLRSRLDMELVRAKRFEHSLSVLLLDVDHFKALNDRHGHAVGDAALRALADIMGRTLRQVDTVARIGGEEFAILLPKANAQQAERIAQHLGTEIQATSLPGCDEQPGGRLTVSIGVTEYEPGDTPNDLLERADRALYRAKRAGRNRTAVIAGRTRKSSGFVSRHANESHDRQSSN